MCRALAAATLALLFAAAGGRASAVEGSRYEEAVRSSGGVIASESPSAARVGLEVLDAGGNAVDAAVATTFALGVARPQSCGIGGGGFMVYRGADGETAALDFRETAPAAVEPETFAGQGLHKTFTGHTTVGVPGTVAGMQAALDSYGSIELAEAIAPAERLAGEGFEVPASLSEEMGNHMSRLRLFPETREQFLVGDEEPYPEGSVLVQPELAETLALIAEGGTKVFYEGEISDRIVEEMQDESGLEGDEGLMTRADLASYKPVWREPLAGDYRGREVLAMPPPTSGGIAVIEMLNILEGFDLRGEGQSSGESLHLLAEAQKLAFADRDAYVADPAQAIDAERIDQQPGKGLTIEHGRVPPPDQAKLLARGHKFERREGEYAEPPRVQAAGADPETGERLAATDPRSGEPASLGQGTTQGSSKVVQGGLPKTGGPPLACFARSLLGGPSTPRR